MDTKQADDAFWGQVEKGAKCWKWKGTTNGKGYGVYNDAGKLEYAHRWAYFVLVGDIQPGQRLFNTCDSRLCVNPEHWSTERPITYKPVQYKRKKKGRKGNFKLSDAQVQAIISISQNSNLTQTAIAARYRISQAHVSLILAEKRRSARPGQ